MDIAQAKEFLYYRDENNTIYFSHDVEKLIELTECHNLNGVFGVVDTPSGEKLFYMDYAYSGEPILMGVFLHKDYFLEYHWTAKHINL